MTRKRTAAGRKDGPAARWSHTAERWRLTKGEAGRLLRLPRRALVGNAPRPPLDQQLAARIAELSDAADAVELAFGSAALALRWLRFPLTADPGVRAIDRLADDPAFAAAISRSVAR